jgi:hypothetical protein
MTTQWTAEMEAATREAVDAPACVEMAGGRGTAALLPAEEFALVRERVPGVPEAAAIVLRPSTGQMYALVPLSEYSRIKPLFEEDPITKEEQQWALRQAGLRAGWNDPEWDDFDNEMAQHEPR